MSFENFKMEDAKVAASIDARNEKKNSLDQRITDYIFKHYGGSDIIVEKWNAKPLPHSTINSPFETICDTLICMTWASPSHHGMKSAIYWNYVPQKAEQ